MQTSSINFSQIEDRIDAEYYKPEFLEIERFLSDSKDIFTIGEIIKSIQHPREFKREYSTVGGIPYLRVSNVKDGYINLSDIEYVYADRNIGLNKINTDNILITRSGTVGIPVLVTPEFNELLISADFLKLVLKEKINNLSVNPYFVYTFLSSKLGLAQSQRKLIGALQKHINTEGLSSIKIPIPSQLSQQKIEKMVKEAQKKRKLADEKYKEAEEILNKELGLKDLDLSTQKTFETKFSEAEDRLDPEYYQSKYKKIISKLKNQKSALLGEIVKIRKGIEVGHEAYTNEGKPFIRVQDFDEKELAVSGSTNYIRFYLYEELKKNHKPNAGEIIFSKDGTVGRAFVIRKDNNEFIVSGGILILTPRDIDNYYLSFVLNSLAVKSQTVRESIGAIIQHLSVEEVKNLKIPILSQSLQQKISFLIQQFFKLRQEAKELIYRAKKEVEEIIEN